MNVISETHRVH